jgi:GNAT superfamily N-acetyltransferase
MQVDWERCRALRREVLGWTDASVPGDQDEDAVHLAVLDQAGTVTAVLSYCPHPYPPRPREPASYFWGVAVVPERQRTGLGSLLLRELFRRSRAAGRDLVWADARQSALEFYRAAGATIDSPPYPDPVTGLLDQRVVFELSRPADPAHRAQAGAPHLGGVSCPG